MAGQLTGKRIGFVVANEGIEQIELTGPWDAITEAGGQPQLIAPEGGSVQAMNHLDKADTFPVDVTFADVRPGDYDAIVLPGGVANPDRLRTDPEAVEWVRAFVESGRPTAVICHAPWTLVEAGVVRGRTVTSWPSLQTDIRNAGATWVDQEVVVDGNLITSRKPDDLDAFCAALVKAVAEDTSRSSAA
jgi:protease I